MRLRPVTFRYTQSALKERRPLQYGLIAEEVAEVLPELVSFDRHGQPETVFYQFLPPLLLHELQQQQRTIEAQAAALGAQKAELAAQAAALAALEARLREFEAVLKAAPR